MKNVFLTLAVFLLTFIFGCQPQDEQLPKVETIITGFAIPQYVDTEPAVSFARLEDPYAFDLPLATVGSLHVDLKDVGAGVFTELLPDGSSLTELVDLRFSVDLGNTYNFGFLNVVKPPADYMDGFFFTPANRAGWVAEIAPPVISCTTQQAMVIIDCNGNDPAVIDPKVSITSTNVNVTNHAIVTDGGVGYEHLRMVFPNVSSGGNNGGDIIVTLVSPDLITRTITITSPTIGMAYLIKTDKLTGQALDLNYNDIFTGNPIEIQYGN